MLHWPQYPHSSSPQVYLSHLLLWRPELLLGHWCFLARSRKMGFFLNSASVNVFLKSKIPLVLQTPLIEENKGSNMHLIHLLDIQNTLGFLSPISVISRGDAEPKLSFSQMSHCTVFIIVCYWRKYISITFSLLHFHIILLFIPLFTYLLTALKIENQGTTRTN